MTYLNGATLQLELRPSRYLMGIFLLLHVVAMMFILALPLPWWSIILVAIILLTSLIFNIEKHVRYQYKSSIRQLRTTDGHNWVLTRKDQQVLEATIMNDSIVTQYLLILNFMTKKKKKYSITILRDMITPHQFRQTQTLLRNQVKKK